MQIPFSPEPSSSECEVVGITEAEIVGFMETLAQNAGLDHNEHGGRAVIQEQLSRPEHTNGNIDQSKLPNNLSSTRTPNKKRPLSSTVLTDTI